MKRITLFTVFMLAICIGSLKAQTNQGRMLVGVSSSLNLAGAGSELMGIGYTSSSYKSDADGYEESDPDKTISVNMSPKVGYFVINNLALGLDLNFAKSIDKDGSDDDKYTRTLLGVGPFVRYYIPTSRVLPFFELSGSYGSVSYEMDYTDNSFSDDSEYKNSLITYGGGVGIAAPLGERVVFDVLAGYNSLTFKSKSDNEDNARSVYNTVSLKIGITVLLGIN